jgi:hypothetical protein
MEKKMKTYKGAFGAILLFMAGGSQLAAQNPTPGTVGVHMVVTVEPLKEGDTTVATLNREDFKVRQGKNDLKVTDWVPARGEAAALQLFILIDDTSDTSLGSQLEDLRSFITAQPATTAIGIGYMRNTTINLAQNFTTDHALSAKALRLPLGSLGASDSPYLSLVSLLKGWPQSKIRREVLMITDGIDRLRGEGARASFDSPYNSRAGMAPGPVMPYISVDVDTASDAAQRAGVIVYSIYARGVGHMGRNYMEGTNGQNGLSKLAEETGGEAFYLGLQNPVSFKPYLDELQMFLDNQYYLAFQAKPGKKDGLQRIKISTETPKVEIVSADNVFVPGAGQAEKKGK